MNGDALSIVNEFSSLRALVIGEAMLDSYLDGTSTRLCREAPVPVVDARTRRDMPGGAANTAANLSSLGATVDFISAVGRDQEGETLEQALVAAGVSSEHILHHRKRRTMAKNRVMAEGHLLLRIDTGTIEPIDDWLERQLVQRLRDLVSRADVVIVSDYGYGILTPRLIAELESLQHRNERTLVVDAKKVRRYARAGVTAVKPNYREAVGLLGLPAVEGADARVDQIMTQGETLLRTSGARLAAVTLDSEGALLLETGRPPYRTYSRRAPNAHATGAGDTFTAVLALALAAGATTPAAAELASAAAAIVIEKAGTAFCCRSELRRAIAGEDKMVADRGEIPSRIRAWRERERRIVFTNGCFDILHRGHITYLNQAKALGDVLVVGLNDDDSVRRLKGPERPIVGLEDRAHVLAALSCVDLIVPFSEDTPEQLLRAVRPDVFVKGGDYTLATLPENDLVRSLGGEIVILPYVHDHSTTGIIDRIRLRTA